MKKISVIFGIFTVAFLFVSCTKNPEPDVTPPIGGDQDEHGCLLAAGYSWCPLKQECIRVWEQNCYEESAEAARYLLALKHSKNMEDVTITIDQETENHAKGSVRFDEGGPGDSGHFLVAKKNGIWAIAFDGNGIPSCAELEPYEFPAEMIEDMCYQ